jgi:hypothetical protein
MMRDVKPPPPRMSARRCHFFVRGNGRCLFAFEGPVSKKFLEPLGHVIAVEITADGHHEIAGVKPFLVKGLEVGLGDRFHGGPRGKLVQPEFFTVGKEAPFALLNARRIVVALLHVLQQLLAAKLKLVILESWGGERLAQNGHAFLQVFGEQIEANGALRIAHIGVEMRGQEGEALFQILGGP